MPVSGAAAPVAARGAGRELVLVVPRSRALPQGGWHGLRPGGVRELLRVVAERGEYRPRSEVESEPDWQQVIPHLVVRSGDRVLALRRLRAGSERRLRGQVTLGVGGHINAEDGEPSQAWLNGCHREWREEVVCDRDLGAEAVGLIKDDTGAVGRVHLGVLILVDAGAAQVEVRERHKLEGRMAPLEELSVYYLEMESWSQFIYDALLQGSLDRSPERIPLVLPGPGSAPPDGC